jgi:hypothetical protein
VIGDVFGETGLARVRRSFGTLQVVALVAVLGLLGFLGLSYGSSESSLGHHLQSHGLRTVGTVTAAAPSNHDYFAYSYTVKGSQYSGNTTSFPSAQTLDAGQLHVGQHIPVVYDAQDPQQSCSCDVNELATSAFSNDLSPFLFAIPVIGAMVIALILRLRKKDQGAGQGTPRGV